ncbi:MAG: nuclease-related domain-containing protein [Desulfuromusa sp.]|jgi:hypothetical protein|nr:nuclease-related domain-containing protein [Desulfuromusa sp.]
MQIIASIAIPAALYLLGVFSFTFPLVWLQKRKQNGKKSPLNGHLLRSPGTSLQRRIEDLNLDIMAYTAIFPTLPLLGYSLYLPLKHAQKDTTLNVSLIIIVIFAVLLWFSFKVFRLVTERNTCRLELDAEKAVGQELNQLMADGCRVYHDFPAEDFNIDHIVVGPTGVFTVETKGRIRAEKRNGKIDATVNYDGNSLQFPGWYETEPLLQAQSQADWLNTWLTSAVGEAVYVQPVLALPGWYVVRKADRPIKLISGKEAYSLAKPSGVNLSAEMIERIAQQVEQRCREVEPIV